MVEKSGFLSGKLELRRQVDPPVDRHLDDVWLESEQIIVDKAEETERNVGKSRTNSTLDPATALQVLATLCLAQRQTKLCVLSCVAQSLHTGTKEMRKSI
jgi:hypothetical protein